MIKRIIFSQENLFRINYLSIKSTYYGYYLN